MAPENMRNLHQTSIMYVGHFTDPLESGPNRPTPLVPLPSSHSPRPTPLVPKCSACYITMKTSLLVLYTLIFTFPLNHIQAEKVLLLTLNNIDTLIWQQGLKLLKYYKQQSLPTNQQITSLLTFHSIAIIIIIIIIIIISSSSSIIIIIKYTQIYIY